MNWECLRVDVKHFCFVDGNQNLLVRKDVTRFRLMFGEVIDSCIFQQGGILSRQGNEVRELINCFLNLS